MKAYAGRPRNLAALIFPVLVGLVGANDASAAPDQATKDRCTQYAQRAVQQYRLMKSHPECQANTDPVTWQDSYDNHYNGCVFFPAKMSAFAESARDNHLQACGALSDASAATDQPGTDRTSGTPAADAAAPGGASSTPLISTGKQSIASGATASAGTTCHKDDNVFGTVLSKEKRQRSSFGDSAVLAGGTLTFSDRATHKQQTYSVARPAFYINMMNCAHAKLGDLDFPWVWVSPDGKEGKLFIIDTTRTVAVTAISGQGARQLLQQF